jgi:hypothetical protein
VALHAARLAFPHPVGGDVVTLNARVPEDLRKIDTRRALQPPVA